MDVSSMRRLAGASPLLKQATRHGLRPVKRLGSGEDAFAREALWLPQHCVNVECSSATSSQRTSKSLNRTELTNNDILRLMSSDSR